MWGMYSNRCSWLPLTLIWWKLLLKFVDICSLFDLFSWQERKNAFLAWIMIAQFSELCFTTPKQPYMEMFGCRWGPIDHSPIFWPLLGLKCSLITWFWNFIGCFITSMLPAYLPLYWVLDCCSIGSLACCYVPWFIVSMLDACLPPCWLRDCIHVGWLSSCSVGWLISSTMLLGCLLLY